MAGKPLCLLSDTSDTTLAAAGLFFLGPLMPCKLGLQLGPDSGPTLSTSVLGGTLSTFYKRGNCGLGSEAHAQDEEPGWKHQCGVPRTGLHLISF